MSNRLLLKRVILFIVCVDISKDLECIIDSDQDFFLLNLYPCCSYMYAVHK